MPPETIPAKALRAWNITIPEHLLQHLDAEARRTCRSRSAYVRWLIQQDLERCKPEAAKG